MSDTPRNTPPQDDIATGSVGMGDSGDLSGISELFGLREGRTFGEAAPSTGTDTVGRWVTATEGDSLVSADVSSRLVHGRYRLIAELGVGGMGVTYRAWDTAAGIPVVVKMPRREIRHDSEAMQRFAREIDAMLSVRHEAIVPITDSGDDEGCPFVVMRFLPGGALSDYRRWDEAGNPIRNPPGMLHFWLPGVASALDHIHSKGMLHRDVKPGNIFLDGFLKPYLGDFGIAKVVDESGGLHKEQTLTATKMAVGTPEYMAPELFKPRSKPDGSVDQYALAVTVYEMLSGEKPFKGDRAHIIVEHSGLPVPPLAAKVPGLPQSLCVAVERALAKNASERFTTCSKFAAAVVAELAVLEPEADTVRLLCPSCKNILKLPERAAGKTGKCPRCQTAMDVAADLGSLWLESEERGEGLVAVVSDRGQPAAPQDAPFELVSIGTKRQPGSKERNRGKSARRAIGGAVQVTALVIVGLGLMFRGLTVGGNHDAVKRQLAWDISRLQASLEALKAENRQLRESLAAATALPLPDRATNSIGMDFIKIHRGEFMMGEVPQVHVKLSRDFLLGRTEVTRGQWEKVMGSFTRGNPRGPSVMDRPVVNISWHDATKFCESLAERERASGALPQHEIYRLPTQAEWEYACRAGTTTAYSCGDDETLLRDVAWFMSHAEGRAFPVGMKKPNPWGLHDMHGNVAEWSADCGSPDPVGGVDPVALGDCSFSVIRGGSWRSSPKDCRSAYRNHSFDRSDKADILGFRVVRSQSVK
jgi:formylglycine-generating enzyme required for sulfatase activity/serine/threonine protein kinase